MLAAGVMLCVRESTPVDLFATDGPPPARKTDGKEAKPVDPNTLESGKPFEVVVAVLGRDGRAVTDAQIVLLEFGGMAAIENGRLVEPRASLQKRPDASGHWHFTTDADEFWLVAVHPSGWAHVKGTRTSPPKTISLTAWARAEGTYAVARQPCANLDIAIDGHVNLGIGNGVANLDLLNRQKTDAHGHFTIDRVIPGLKFIQRVRKRKPNQPPEMSSICRMDVDFVAGQTTRVDFGMSGRAVIGRLKRPADGPNSVWDGTWIDIRRERRPGMHELSFSATVDDRGEFTIDGVPTGKYYLSASSPGPLHRAVYAFEVPPISEKLSGRPVDLGTITLKKFEPPGNARRPAGIVRPAEKTR